MIRGFSGDDIGHYIDDEGHRAVTDLRVKIRRVAVRIYVSISHSDFMVQASDIAYSSHLTYLRAFHPMASELY